MAVIILAFPLGHMSSVHRPLIRAFDNLPSARVTAPELHELLIVPVFCWSRSANTLNIENDGYGK